MKKLSVSQFEKFEKEAINIKTKRGVIGGRNSTWMNPTLNADVEVCKDINGTIECQVMGLLPRDVDSLDTIG